MRDHPQTHKQQAPEETESRHKQGPPVSPKERSGDLARTSSRTWSCALVSLPQPPRTLLLGHHAHPLANGQRMRNECKPRVAGAGSTRGGIDAGSGPHAGHANVNSPSSRVRSEEFAFEPSIYQPLPLAADHTAYQFLRSGLNNLEESKPCLKKS